VTVAATSLTAVFPASFHTVSLPLWPRTIRKWWVISTIRPRWNSTVLRWWWFTTFHEAPKPLMADSSWSDRWVSPALCV
jgi:hypothetical protein